MEHSLQLLDFEAMIQLQNSIPQSNHKRYFFISIFGIHNLLFVEKNYLLLTAPKDGGVNDS